MKNNPKTSFEKSIKIKQKILKHNLTDVIIQMAATISKRIESGNKLLLCGNGGSAGDAQHLAAELIVRLRSQKNRKALPAITLALDTSTLTACANDFGFDRIFERTLESIGLENDILLVISTSGNSKNIIRAMKKAKKMGVNVFGFLGSGGGRAIKYCDKVFLVPSNDTGHIQESHITAGHALVACIEDNLYASRYLK